MLTKEQIFGMYIGNNCTDGTYLFKLKDVNMYGGLILLYANEGSTNYGIETRYSIDDCKLILRTQEDMTEKEIKMFYKLHDDIHCGYDAQHTEYLISIGIDVFNAIGKGWAVRKGEGNETE